MNNTVFFFFLIVFLNACKPSTEPIVDLNSQNWIHGATDCSTNNEEPIQVVQYNSNTWILRQNKCVHYEAPFLFLFLGEEKALLMDTGATENLNSFPLQPTVSTIIDNWEKQKGNTIELIVAHTHGHSDHFAGDTQFKEIPNTKIVGLTVNEVIDFFEFKNWPQETTNLNLGNRVLKIIPIPGHQVASIAIYDTSSKILLTGDTFYPGRLYIEDWITFKESIKRLVDFSNDHEISHILGNHIEMSKTPGKDYPIGATYQPDEHQLPLTEKELSALHIALEKSGNTSRRKTLPAFIIYPTK